MNLMPSNKDRNTGYFVTKRCHFILVQLYLQKCDTDTLKDYSSNRHLTVVQACNQLTTFYANMSKQWGAADCVLLSSQNNPLLLSSTYYLQRCDNFSLCYLTKAERILSENALEDLFQYVCFQDSINSTEC